MRHLAFEPTQTTWGDLVTVKQGKYVAKPNLASSRSEDAPVPTVGANGVLGYVSKPSYQRRVPLVTCRGSNCGLIQYPLEPVWVSNNAMALDAGTDEANSFIYYLALNTDFNDVVSGSAQPQITAGPLKNKAVSVPPREYWPAIAATLGALDDKIESNRRIIGLIPRLVRAHVNSAISHSSTFISVSDLATFVNGGAYTKGATGTGRMVIRIAELNSGPGRSTVYNDIKVPDEKIARAGDILMSWSGSLGVYRWYRDEAIINQHIFKVSPTGYPAWLVFDRLNEVMSVFRGVAADKATTMGHIQRGHLISTNVEIPTQGALEELETKISPLWDRLLLAERENLDLEQLRDALLPELLSGRIHVTAEGAEA